MTGLEFLHRCHVMVQKILEHSYNENQLQLPSLVRWQEQRLSNRFLRHSSDTLALAPKLLPVPIPDMPRTVTLLLEHESKIFGKCIMTTAVPRCTHCRGYEDHGTIVVCYTVPSRNYTLLSYIPDVSWGKDLLKRLQYAFVRGVTFVPANNNEKESREVCCRVVHNTRLTRTSWKKLILRANQQLDVLLIPRADFLLFSGIVDTSRMKIPPSP